MSNAYDAMIETLKEEIAERKRAINKLLSLQGREPAYTDASLSTGTGSAKIRSDQFYGTPSMSVAAREYLDMRGQAVGPATVDEIYSALAAGSFRFENDESVAKPALKQSLTKNTAIFHRLPNGMVGLLKWYPNRTNGEGGEDPAKPRRFKKIRGNAVAKKHESTHLPEVSPKTSLFSAVKDAIEATAGNFKNRDILGWLDRERPTLKASTRPDSVFSMICRLRKDLGVVVVTPAKGKEPAIYKRQLAGS